MLSDPANHPAGELRDALHPLRARVKGVTRLHEVRSGTCGRWAQSTAIYLSSKLWSLVPGALAIVLVGYAEVLGGQRLRPCRAAATSIRTKSSSLTGPPIF